MRLRDADRKATRPTRSLLRLRSTEHTLADACRSPQAQRKASDSLASTASSPSVLEVAIQFAPAILPELSRDSGPEETNAACRSPVLDPEGRLYRGPSASSPTSAPRPHATRCGGRSPHHSDKSGSMVQSKPSLEL